VPASSTAYLLGAATGYAQRCTSMDTLVA
jgi:hypothetical protein